MSASILDVVDERHTDTAPVLHLSTAATESPGHTGPACADGLHPQPETAGDYWCCAQPAGHVDTAGTPHRAADGTLW